MVGVAPSAFAVKVVGQGRLVAGAIEPQRQSSLRNARAVRVGQGQSLVEPWEHSPSGDAASGVATAQVQFQGRGADGVPVVAVVAKDVRMMPCSGEVVWPDAVDSILSVDLDHPKGRAVLGRL